MSKNQKSGQWSAFPISSAAFKNSTQNRELREDCVGISKRYYTACMAMQGLLMSGKKYEGYGAMGGNWVEADTQLVEDAFYIADEMLRQEDL